MKNIEIYSVDDDLADFLEEGTLIVKQSDHEAAMALKDEEIKYLKEQRNEAYRQHIEQKYSGVSAIEIYEQTKYEAELQIQSALQRLAKG